MINNSTKKWILIGAAVLGLAFLVWLLVNPKPDEPLHNPYGSPAPRSQSIPGTWRHQFGPWQLEFRSGGQMLLSDLTGQPVAGQYQLDASGRLEIETAGGGVIRARAKLNLDGNLLLERESSNVPIFGDDGRAVFILVGARQ